MEVMYPHMENFLHFKSETFVPGLHSDEIVGAPVQLS
jgi:hypothetical protein